MLYYVCQVTYYVCRRVFISSVDPIFSKNKIVQQWVLPFLCFIKLVSIWTAIAWAQVYSSLGTNALIIYKKISKNYISWIIRPLSLVYYRILSCQYFSHLSENHVSKSKAITILESSLFVQNTAVRLCPLSFLHIYKHTYCIICIPHTLRLWRILRIKLTP